MSISLFVWPAPSARETGAQPARGKMLISGRVSTVVPLPSQPSPPPPKPPDGAIGIYLTANSVERNDGYLKQSLRELKEAGGSAIVIDVKDSSIFFETSSPLAHGLQLIRRKYDLRKIVRLAKRRGFSVIARFVVAKDTGLASRHFDTHIRHPATGKSVGNVWVDPGNPVVLEYNRQVLEDVVAAGVDEINLDYIRYPTEYAASSIGLTGREKADHVEAFLRMARETIAASDKNVKLGISTYAILGWPSAGYEQNLGQLGQDVPRFAPIVDVISPMAYPASFKNGHYVDGRFGRSPMYELVFRTLEGYKELLGAEHAWKLRPWIQGYRVSPVDMRDEMDAVYDSGLCGFTVWSPSNFYWAFSTAMERFEVPERCRF